MNIFLPLLASPNSLDTFGIYRVHHPVFVSPAIQQHVSPTSFRRGGEQVMVLYEKIQNDPLEFPPEVNMSPGLRRLLMAMMEKGPAKRITLDQVKETG